MPDPSCIFDALEPRRKKVAIVGFASSSRNLAPFADQSWEVWGMNQLYRFISRATRWWEIHQRYGPEGWLADVVPGTDYLGWMRACPIPIVMQEHHADIPASVAFPLEDAMQTFGLESMRADAPGKGYFHNSVDYMICLAVMEGFEEIGIWGVDMAHDSEYGDQRPSCEFWLGVVKGRGIKLTVPTESSLLNSRGYRYGYDPLPRASKLSEQLVSRRHALQERANALNQELTAVQGALQENAHWTEFEKATARGVSVPMATSTNG